MKIEQYIEIIEAGLSASGITKIFNVRNKRTGEIVGELRWRGGFRKYCFYPSDGFLFDSDCLDLIAEKLRTVNLLHKFHKQNAN